MPKRIPKDRHAVRAILEGAPGRIVLPELKDNIGFLNGRDREIDVTVPEWVQTCASLGVEAHIIKGEAEYLPPEHPLGWKVERISHDSEETRLRKTIPAPDGPLTIEAVIQRGDKEARTRMALAGEEDYPKLVGYLRALREAKTDITSHFRDLRRQAGDLGVLAIFIPQPLEMHYVILQQEMIFHFLDFPETYRAAMAEVEATSHTIIDCAAEADCDMIIFGGAGTEVFSPDMIEEGIVRPSIGFAKHCRERNLPCLMHCCGRTQVFLDRGWFHDLQPAIFESFTAEPLGDIADPPAAAHALPEEVHFKGGLSLERLLRGTPAEAADLTRQAYEAFGDRRFILAGTCAILTGTPRENLEAVADAALAYE